MARKEGIRLVSDLPFAESTLVVMTSDSSAVIADNFVRSIREARVYGQERELSWIMEVASDEITNNKLRALGFDPVTLQPLDQPTTLQDDPSSAIK